MKTVRKDFTESLPSDFLVSRLNGAFSCGVGVIYNALGEVDFESLRRETSELWGLRWGGERMGVRGFSMAKLLDLLKRAVEEDKLFFSVLESEPIVGEIM